MDKDLMRKSKCLDKIRFNLKMLIYIQIGSLAFNLLLYTIFSFQIAIPSVGNNALILYLSLTFTLNLIIAIISWVYSIITIVKLFDYDYKKESQHNDLRTYSAIYLSVGFVFIILLFVFWIIGLILGFKFIKKEEKDSGIIR